MRRSTALLLVPAVSGVLAMLGTAAPATAGDDPYSVSVDRGSAGPCQLGAPPPRGLAAAGPGLLRTGDGGLHCRVERGRVAEIRVTSSLYFTGEHLLRAGSSTITEVVAAHGSPAATERTADALIVVYDGLRFHFPLAADPKDQRGMKLGRIDLGPVGPAAR
jgi:hypothetical protein